MRTFSINEATKEAAFKAAGFSELREIYQNEGTLKLSSKSIRDSLMNDYGFSAGQASGTLRRACVKKLLFSVGNAEYVYNIDFPLGTAPYIDNPNVSISTATSLLHAEDSTCKTFLQKTLYKMFHAMGQGIGNIVDLWSSRSELSILHNALASLSQIEVSADISYDDYLFAGLETEHALPVLRRYACMLWDAQAYIPNNISITDISESDMTLVVAVLSFLKSVSADVLTTYTTLNMRFNNDLYETSDVTAEDIDSISLSCPMPTHNARTCDIDKCLRLEAIPDNIHCKIGTGDICFGIMHI